MKIATRIHISTLLSISIACVVGLIFLFAARQVSEEIENNRLIAEVVRGIFELNVITNDCLKYHGKRAEVQWQSKHDSLGKLLREIEVKNREEKLILESLREDHEKLKTWYFRLVATLEMDRSHKEHTPAGMKLEKRLAGQLDVRALSMTSNISRLHEASDLRIRDAEQRASLLAIGFLATIVVLVAGISFTLNKSVTKPLTRLYKGTEIVGTGNLEYKIGMTVNDEIGQLSKAFDQMTEKLQKTTVSRDKLVEQVTRRKQLEAQLLETKKMEAIATLAGGIAHEFNNTLVGITGNIELLQMEPPDDVNIDKYAERMKASALHMANLTDQLLAYAEGGKYQPKNISLSDFVEETLPLIKQTIDPSIRIETDLPCDILNVEADLTQMQMVLSALLINASEAKEGKGRIRITTREEEIDEEFVKTSPGLKPGPYVCLTVEDDGKGMDEETRAKIFDPFFTTKFQGRGLGMAAVHGIVTNHDGWTSVDSELGKGTVVRIYLPAIASARPPSALTQANAGRAQARRAGLRAVKVQVKEEEKPKIETAKGTGTILVIEDEDVVIDVILAMLKRLGYRILLAKTGKEAVNIAKTFDGDIDLAILDIVLPDLAGKEVYRHIMEARPNLKVIVCSGYAIDGPPQEILDEGAQDFIQKPFFYATLSEKLKEVLEGKLH